MKVAIASGKGGTGKTTVAVNLARVAADAGLRVQSSTAMSRSWIARSSCDQNLTA